MDEKDKLIIDNRTDADILGLLPYVKSTLLENKASEECPVIENEGVMLFSPENKDLNYVVSSVENKKSYRLVISEQ